ncbi:MAG: PAS domain-containing protein [Pseudomonadota bacterium]
MAQTRLILAEANHADRRGLMQALDAAQAIMWFSIEGDIVEANAKAQALFAMPQTELQQRSYFDLVGADAKHAKHIARHWARIATGIVPAEERDIFVPGTNRSIWSSVSYAALRDEENKVRRVFALVIDLSPWSWRPKDDYSRVR